MNPPEVTRLHLNLRQLEVFVATARSGSTRAAARKVARSQSSASTALSDLEDVLGACLFDRVGRRLVLNENGRSLLPRAAALLDGSLEVEHLFSGERATPLQVAASMTIGEFILPEMVSRWRQQHAKSPVRLAIANTSDVIAAVASFNADVGFIEGPHTHPDVVVSPWLRDELVIVAAPGHALAGRAVTPKALGEAEWALRERGSGTREAADRWLIEHVGRLNVAYEIGSAESIKRLVATSRVLGFLSRHAVADELARGRLVELSTRLPAATRRLAIVIHRDRRLGAGAEDFVRHCRAAAKELGPPGV
ncbi:MAG: LysR family transcriptional regulator [Burkholderiales bacterium]|nr:LysR family transcriptional regulator [Burkholderiales bacterium]MDE2457447.1 LysR family transcriptional regulator [Burkholderiales bacterium]